MNTTQAFESSKGFRSPRRRLGRFAGDRQHLYGIGMTFAGQTIFRRFAHNLRGPVLPHCWEHRSGWVLQVKTASTPTFGLRRNQVEKGDGVVSGRRVHDRRWQCACLHNLHLFEWKWTDWDRQLEDIISSYWVNFAASGDPNGLKLPKWTAYSTAQQDRVMILGDTVEVGPSRLNAQKIALFDAYYKRLLSK